jgi:hypothetical protein
MAFSVAGSLGTVLVEGIDYKQLKAKGDNSCLFHSVGYLLVRMGKNDPAPTDAPTLRARTCDRIALLLNSEDTPDRVKDDCRQHVYTVMNVGEAAELAKDAALTQYVVNMRADSAWGDLLCVYALELIYNVRIAVYHIDYTGATKRANFPNAAGDATLRIVTPYTGQAGIYNHYNPLVSEPTELENVQPVEAAEESLSDARQWEYWNEKKLCLFQPASCHSQYKDVWTATPLARGGSLTVSNTSEHVIDRGKPRVLSVVLSSKPMKAPSLSFRADLPRESLNIAVVEPFLLLLSRDKDGKATPAIDCSGITVELDLTLFELIENISFDVFTRANDVPVASGELLRVVLAKLAKGEAGNQKLSIPLADLFTPEELLKLTYSGSPFRLVACTNGRVRGVGIDSTQWAFTYFHVPDAWDVNTVEGVQASRIIPVQDSLAGLTKVTAATVSVRSASNDLAVKPPPELGPNNEKITEFLASLADPENAAYSAVNHNVFWQLADKSYYVATSWASIIVLVKDGENGYTGHSLLLHGSPKVFLASLEAQAKAAKLVDKKLVLLRKLESELNVLRSQLRMHPSLSLGAWDPTGWFENDHIDVAAAKVRVNTAAEAIRNDAMTIQYVKAAKCELMLNEKESVENRLAKIKTSAVLLDKLVQSAAAEVSKEVRPKAISEVDGENDFEGFRSGTKKGWKQYFLPPGMKISKAITQGISSCAGGATFTDEETPEFIILWHIDFPPWVPIKQIIQQLKPELKECPALRTVGLVYPDCAELNKYRPAMIYPEEIRGRCKSVFMTRGDHLGVEDFSLGSGSEYFGLDLSNPRRPDLVFTHDINKRTEMVSKRDKKNSDADVSITLDAFHRNVFGGYRYGAIPVAGHDVPAMKIYTTTVANTDNDAVKRDKLSKCSVVRLAGVGTALFDAMDLAATPVLDTPCFMLGLRVEQEFGDATPDIQARRAWRTGHQDRTPKVKAVEK